jgi:hypothetical protein
MLVRGGLAAVVLVGEPGDVAGHANYLPVVEGVYKGSYILATAWKGVTRAGTLGVMVQRTSWAPRPLATASSWVTDKVLVSGAGGVCSFQR